VHVAVQRPFRDAVHARSPLGLTNLTNRRLRFAVAALLAALLGSACGRSGGEKGAAPAAGGGAPNRAGRAGRLQIVTTVAPITSIAASVVGDRAVITGIVPEGTNSHTFEPPPSAAAVLSKADIVFVNGLKLEDPTRDLAQKNLEQGAEIVELGSQTIRPQDYIYDFSFPKEGGKPNPHLWTDPLMAKRYAELIADTLVKRDAANAATYRSNEAKFAAKADELSTAVKTATATLPPERRKLLTYHDGYAYFARDYGWTVIGAIQPSSFEDPAPRDVAKLIQQIKAEKVPAIFGSEVFPSPVLEQIGKEAGVRYVDVLRDDDLPGEPGATAHSWLGLMRFDYITMVESLGGDASALKAVTAGNVAKDTASYPQ
jgi:ABC-type Zn uptake system ZnuABC Zn-binding protein ZnuA